MQYQFTNSSYDDKLRRGINILATNTKTGKTSIKPFKKELKSNIPGQNYPSLPDAKKPGKNTNTDVNTKNPFSPIITEKLEQNRIAKAAGSSIFKFVDENKIPKFAKLTERKPDDYYRKFPNYAEENKRLKELFGAKTDFSITNYENNFDMMNPDEQTMFTGKAQGFFNRKGYTDKNGKRLKEDGIWGPKTQKTYEKHKEDVKFSANEISELSMQSSDIPEALKTLESKNEFKKAVKPISIKDDETDSMPVKKTDFSDFDSIIASNSSNKPYYYNSYKDLRNFFAKEYNSNYQMNQTQYENLLNKHAVNSDLRKDVTQYSIFKLLRAINNAKKNPNAKSWAVVKFIADTLKLIADPEKNKCPSTVTYALKQALKSTNKKDIDNGYVTNMTENWFNVFVKYYDLTNEEQFKVNQLTKNSIITADVLDSGINQIINKYNQGATYAEVFVSSFSGVQSVIYDTHGGWRDSLPSHAIVDDKNNGVKSYSGSTSADDSSSIYNQSIK